MNSPYWFEFAVVFALTGIGNILFSHFAAETPKWRRIAKILVAAPLAVLLSATAGRAWFFVALAAISLFVVVIHAWWRPKKGVNGWTGEPRERYYALRGWKLKPPQVR